MATQWVIDPRGLEYSPSGAIIRQFRPTSVQNAFDIAALVPEPTSLTAVGVAILLLIGCAPRRSVATV
jgi:hypothetical protein